MFGGESTTGVRFITSLFIILINDATSSIPVKDNCAHNLVTLNMFESNLGVSTDLVGNVYVFFFLAIIISLNELSSNIGEEEELTQIPLFLAPDGKVSTVYHFMVPGQGAKSAIWSITPL